MKIKIIALILFLNTFVLFADWEAIDKGYISNDTLIGNKRYIPDENALVIESKYSIKKFDLNTGEIIKEIVFDDTTHSLAVADDNLDKVYLLYDTLIPRESIYKAFILNFHNKDTIAEYKLETPDSEGVTVRKNLSLLNNSILVSSSIIKQSYYIFQSYNTFTHLFKLDTNNQIINSGTSNLYMSNYNQCNQSANKILADGLYTYSTGKHGGYSYSRLLNYDLSNFSEKTIKFYQYQSNNGGAIRADFKSYTQSNYGNYIYHNIIFYHQTFSPGGDLINLKQTAIDLINEDGNIVRSYSLTFGDFVKFSNDDNWLISTSMRGNNSVDFKVFSVNGELIFTDNVSNITNEQIICSTDSTYFFESGDRILKYNPFNYNLTNVSVQNTNNILDFYPNPSSNFLNIILPEINSSTEVTIINQTGNIVESVSLGAGTIKDQPYELDVSLYPDGIYFILVSTPNKIITGKFIKR